MLHITEPIADLSNEIKRYINFKVNYFTLKLSRRIAVFTSFLIMAIIFAGIIGFILMMLSFAFVFWYGQKVGSYYHGFLIVSLVYAVIGILVLAMHQKLLLDPIIRKLNRKLEPADEDEKDLPEFRTIKDIDHHTEIIRLKIQQSELQMQLKLQEFGENINPINIAKSLLGNFLSTTSMITTAMELAITWLRKNEKEKEVKEKEEESLDS